MNILYKNYLKYLFLLINIKTIKSTRDFDISFSKSNCSIMNKNFVAEYICPIIELPRNRGNYLQGNIQFKRDITKIFLEFRINMPSKGKDEVELVKFRIDGCKLASYKANNPIVTSILKKLRSGGNFPGGCPLKANVNYTVEHFALNPDYFPPYTPDMNFGAKLNMFMGKVHLIAAEVQATIHKKKRKNGN